MVAGAVLILVGAGVGIRGTLDLGRNRTAYPAPKTDGKLVTHGIYAWIRHPLYTALVLIALGWGLCWCSWPALAGGVLLAVLLERKARVEESGMTERYSGYAEYARRVKRFLPGVY
jgi:protein-S-isoprenylcysteine O-methyltransferase Ste14